MVSIKQMKFNITRKKNQQKTNRNKSLKVQLQLVMQGHYKAQIEELKKKKVAREEDVIAWKWEDMKCEST